MPVLAKMMIADEQIHPKEREMIVNNLVYKWGYCREFIENYLEKTLNNPKLKNFKYEDIAKLIDSVVKSDKGLNKENLVQVILQEVEELMYADDNADRREMQEYTKLINALRMS